MSLYDTYKDFLDSSEHVDWTDLREEEESRERDSDDNSEE